jgi:polyisoprenyl-phosphate glycosyltransferase
MAGEPMSAMTRAAGNPAASCGLSIIVPLFNEANGLAALHSSLIEVARRLRQARGLATEAIYVDDGSSDATVQEASKLSPDGIDVQVIALSRNFGKEAALLAGLDHARHGAVVFMDGDGQHPPALIERLVRHWLDDGYDVVYTAKAHRENESRLRRLGVKIFYALVNWGARQKIPQDAGDFRLLRGPLQRCGNFPNAIDSSKGWRAGSGFDRSASTMNRRSAGMAAQAGTCIPCWLSQSRG